MSDPHGMRRAFGPLAVRVGGHTVWVSVLMCCVLLAGIFIGETLIPWRYVLSTLANHLLDTHYPVDALDTGIVWNYHLTRVLVSASCGACLAVSGAVLQSLLRNALAKPYLLRVSAGASTGAVLIALTGLGAGVISMSLGAFIDALTALMFVTLLAMAADGRQGGGVTTQIILADIVSSRLLNAITSFIITCSANAEQTRGIVFWLLGNLSGVRWPDVALAIPTTLVSIVLCFYYVRHLDAFSFGAESTASLGIPVKHTRTVLIAAVTGMTVVMVSIVGAIGFIGLVIPHAAHLLIGNQHHRLLPVSALTGAIFLIIVDVIPRTLLPGRVLSIGVVTALVDAPAFSIVLIRGNQNK